MLVEMKWLRRAQSQSDQRVCVIFLAIRHF